MLRPPLASAGPDRAGRDEYGGSEGLADAPGELEHGEVPAGGVGWSKFDDKSVDRRSLEYLGKREGHHSDDKS